MSGVNKVFVLGNLGRDPDFRQMSSGGSVCTLSIATSRTHKDASGNQVEETEWHRVVCFARAAEIARDYLTKGRQVHIEGHLRTRKYTDKEGVERYVTEIICDNLTLLSGRGDAPAESKPKDTYVPHVKDSPDPVAKKQDTDLDEDIPF